MPPRSREAMTTGAQALVRGQWGMPAEAGIGVRT